MVSLIHATLQKRKLMKKVSINLFLALFMLLQWGVPGFTNEHPDSVSRTDWFLRAPSDMASKVNPFEGNQEAVLAGKKLYQRHCAQCHGQDALGKGKAPGLISMSLCKAAPGAILWFLKRGALRQGMPDWSRLPEPQLWQIVNYLKTIQSACSLERTPLLQ